MEFAYIGTVNLSWFCEVSRLSDNLKLKIFKLRSNLRYTVAWNHVTLLIGKISKRYSRIELTRDKKNLAKARQSSNKMKLLSGLKIDS